MTRDPRKLDVCWLNVAGHVVLSSHHLATSQTLPDLLAHFVSNLSHPCVYLRVQFFQCSVLACKTWVVGHDLISSYIYTFCSHLEIFMHCGDVASKSIPCFWEFSTDVTTDPGELNMRRFNVSCHIILVGHYLSASKTFPDWVTKLIGALLHEFIDLCVKFFKSSAIACKYFALD